MAAISHHWSGAPGIFCYDCGNGSPLDEAVCCGDCETDGRGMVTAFCDRHREWNELLATGCPPDMAAIAIYNAKWFPASRPPATEEES